MFSKEFQIVEESIPFSGYTVLEIVLLHHTSTSTSPQYTRAGSEQKNAPQFAELFNQSKQTDENRALLNVGSKNILGILINLGRNLLSKIYTTDLALPYAQPIYKPSSSPKSVFVMVNGHRTSATMQLATFRTDEIRLDHRREGHLIVDTTPHVITNEYLLGILLVNRDGYKTKQGES